MFARSPRTLVGVATIAIVLLATPSPANAGAADLSTARAATAHFQQIDQAKGAGYGLFVDAAKIDCIASPGVGVMGIHYVKFSLLGDGAVDAATPEALVYQRLPNEKLRLVEVEYIVPFSTWAGNEEK